MRIGIVRDGSAAAHRAALLEGAARLLRDWGAEADVISSRGDDAPAAHDLYVVAGDADATLDLAARLAARGSVLLDPLHALRALRDRGAVLRRLEAEGVAVARERRRSSRIHRLDCIGGQVFGTDRSGPVRRRQTVVTLGADLRRVALLCAEVLELKLVSVDVAVEDSRFAVKRVSAFPSLRGVPNAALRLADFVYATALHAARGEGQGRLSLP